MQFYSPEQHSLEQITSIEQALRERKLAAKKALFVATQLVVHGSDRADAFIRRVRGQIDHPDAHQYFDRLSRQAKFIRGIPGLDEVMRTQALRSELYKLDGIYFARGERHPGKLLVVFTTMYNNFYVSNLVLFALLRQFGVSILFLKDTTLLNYLNGIVGFGSDIEQVSQNVVSLAAREKISEIYITGFSSGGYASLMSSGLLPCAGYLGFSVASDLSRNSAIKPPKFFTEDVRQRIDQQWLKNLRTDLLGSAEFPRRDIFFGQDYTVDAAHAKNLEGIPGTTVIGLRDCTHLTIASLIESDRLASTFHALLFESDNVLGNLSKR
jgi:hypothetical protein